MDQPDKILADIQNLEGLLYKITKREPEAIAELNRLYRLLYGETVTAGCSNCHIKAYHKLTSLTLQKLIDMSNSNFKIKKGVLVEYPYPGTFYSSVNGIPDAVAVKYLDEFPERKDLFESIDSSQLGKAAPAKSKAKPAAATTEPKPLTGAAKIAAEKKAKEKEAAEKEAAEKEAAQEADDSDDVDITQ